MARRWKPILGYEDCCSVSDDGLVARTATYGENPKPKWKLLAKRIKKKHGYLTYHLCKDGKRSDQLAHLLVWRTFKGPIPDGLEINHKNNIRADPRLSNLDLMTRSENVAFGFRVHGRPPANNPSPGSTNGSAKLSESDIPKIFAMSRNGKTQHIIARSFGVSQPLIGKILRREGWQHVHVPALLIPIKCPLGSSTKK